MLPDLARHTEKLYYFYAMIQEGSLQGTSRKLNISPATLSYNLKELESSLGVSLFTRNRKGLVPTEAGEKLAMFCRRLYRELDDLQLQIQSGEAEDKRKVRVGTFSSIAIYFWPLLQDELRAEKSLVMSIMTKRSREILETLMKREIDVAITVGTLRHPDVKFEELYRDSYGFYARPGLFKSNPTLEDLRKATLLYIPDAIDEEGKSLRTLVHNLNITFKDEYELDSFDVIAPFVKKGYGVGILPTKVADNIGKGLTKVNIPGLGKKTFGEHRFYLSYRRDSDLMSSDLQLVMSAATKAVLKLG